MSYIVLLNILIRNDVHHLLRYISLDRQSVRHEYMDVEAQFAERKSSYDKIAVGLEIEKQTLEKDCDTYQVKIKCIHVMNMNSLA